MSKTFTSGSCKVHTGAGSLHKLNAFLSQGDYSGYFIICDDNTSRDCLPVLLFNCEALLSAEIIELESGEENKTIDTCTGAWSALQELGADRRSLVINLGGGVITDMGGFIASTYKRGIDFVNIPTSLLAMVDASVGGKNGVDVDGIKNQVGTITLPQRVLVDPVFLESLPTRHIINGAAEIIKIAAVRDAAFLKQVLGFNSAADYTTDAVIAKAIALKHAVVKEDPTEKGLRKCLNFGHSLGHALESACLESRLDLLHGEAIAAGMILETHVAHAMKQCSKTLLNQLTACVLKQYPKIRISQSLEERMSAYLKHDKKNENNQLVFAIADKAGSFKLLKGIKPGLIEEAIAYYNALN